MGQLTSKNLYRTLSLASRIKLYAAVFLLFSPLSLIAISSFSAVRPWPVLVAWIVTSGSIAVLWVLTFTSGPRYLFLLIPLNAAPLLFSRHYEASASVEGIGSAAMIVLGFVFIMIFINGEGSRALRLQSEVNLAAEIHSDLVPVIEEAAGQVEIYGRSIACSEVGGDLLDVARSRGTVGISIADVTGHGTKAGVMMAMVKSAIRTRLLCPGNLGELLQGLHEVMADITPIGMFVTFAGVRCDGSATAEFALAGHPPHPPLFSRLTSTRSEGNGRRGASEGMTSGGASSTSARQSCCFGTR